MGADEGSDDVTVGFTNQSFMKQSESNVVINGFGNGGGEKAKEMNSMNGKVLSNHYIFAGFAIM